MTLKTEYKVWIATNVDNPRNKCRDYSHAMAAAFPELKLVRGHYIDLYNGTPDPHWWLETSEGEKVDPTLAQFLDGGRGQYIPWDESNPEPTGKCMNCGGYCYDNAHHCSDACEKETKRLFNGG